MGIDQRLGDRQPQAKSAEAARGRGVALLKGVEDLREQSRVDADAGVGDLNADGTGRRVGRGDANRAAGRCELPGALHEVWVKPDRWQDYYFGDVDRLTD